MRLSASKTLWQILIIGSYLSLICLIFLWSIVLSPSSIFPKSLVLIVLVLPLLIPFKGVLNLKPKTLILSAVLVLVYFALGISNLMVSNHPKYLSGLEIALALVYSLSAGLYVKHKNKNDKKPV